jgi:serine/threonine-protein kinase RsbT
MTLQQKVPEKVYIFSEIDVAYAALNARKFAEILDFSTVNQMKISLATSELAKNIIKYAGHGVIIFKIIKEDSKIGIEIIAKDSGPGINDLEDALKDNFSTGGTLGIGLPGTKRMMDTFNIESSSIDGTKITIKKWM